MRSGEQAFWEAMVRRDYLNQRFLELIESPAWKRMSEGMRRMAKAGVTAREAFEQFRAAMGPHRRGGVVTVADLRAKMRRGS